MMILRWAAIMLKKIRRLVTKTTILTQNKKEKGVVLVALLLILNKDDWRKIELALAKAENARRIT